MPVLIYMATTNSSHYDHSITFAKGIAILGAVFIHVLDWSNYITTDWLLTLKELTYPIVFIFVACSGALALISYNRKPFKIFSSRMLTRGAQLIGIYYLYNLVKLFIYDFRVEDFYLKFKEAGTLDVWGVISLQSFTAPVAIIFTIGVFLMLTPLIMRIVNPQKLPWALPLLIGLLLLLNYSGIYPDNQVLNFLLARGNVTFPLLLWLPVYLIGMYLAQLGFSRASWVKLLVFTLVTVIYAMTFIDPTRMWLPREFAYPISIYYMLFSVTAMYALVNVYSLLSKFSAKITEPIEILGEATFSFFIGHLVVIDLTRWVYPNNPEIVLYTTPLYMLVALGYKYIRRYLIPLRS